jgi:riboflavin synthase
VFSGLIGYRGTVVSVDGAGTGTGATLRVRCQGVAEEMPDPKDSIAINGVCLTVTVVDQDDVITFDAVPETLTRSTLGALRQGDTVNVEYSLRLGDRMGGHFVYGHVDTTATIVSRAAEGQGARLRIERAGPTAGMIVDKAFIAIDGVSLTVAGVGDGWFEVALIPETLSRTTFVARNSGDRVNIEIDPIARYTFAAVETTRA